MAQNRRQVRTPIEDPATDASIRQLDSEARRLSKFLVPTGCVLDWRGPLDADGNTDESYIPDGWLYCGRDDTQSYEDEFLPNGDRNPYWEGGVAAGYTGRRVLISEYPELYAVLGHTYGGRSSNGEFRLPDETPAQRIIKT